MLADASVLALRSAGIAVSVMVEDRFRRAVETIEGDRLILVVITNGDNVGLNLPRPAGLSLNGLIGHAIS